MASASQPTTPILNFYLDHPIGHHKLSSILSFSKSELEYHHDFIQWLFPLPESSPVNPDAPTITAADCEAFRSDPKLRQNVLMALEKMLNFYGFEIKRHHPCTDADEPVSQDEHAVEPSKEGQRTTTSIPSESEITIVRSAHFPRAARNWATRFNHNHLRITRIIRSLRVLGFENEAQAFFAALQDACRQPAVDVSQKSQMFWERAAKRPLNVPPSCELDEERWDEVGKKWLREYDSRSGMTLEGN